MSASQFLPTPTVRQTDRRHESMVAVATVLAVVLLGASAQAQTASPSSRATASDRAIQNFWTPERLLTARPVTPTPGRDFRPMPLPVTPDSAGAPEIGAPGAGPTRPDDRSLARRLHAPIEGIATPPSSVAPANTSSTGAHFTTARVHPDTTVSAAPYRIAGKLFAYNPVSRATLNCSASVIRPRLVVTAGHCVYHAGPTSDEGSSNRYFYTNLTFIPAYTNGSAPLGSWSYTWVIVSGTWASGGGKVPNAQDVAILETADKNGVKISAYTGYFGYGTGGLSPNHLTIIGYPCNIDACRRMQHTNAGSYASGGSNTVIYGSAMGGGASGGPWVQDFGIPGSGSPSGTGRNILRSVSSYGPSNSGPLYLGGSILLGSGAGSFGSMMSTACAHRAGNC